MLLLLFRDTIFSFQLNFVPALLVTEGGPPPYETTYLPLFVYRTGFEYLRYGYAAAATVIMFLITALIVFIQWRITLPLMAPVLLLLFLRDTIFSLQLSFVPALVVTDGGPPPYATTYLPLFVYRNAFEYLRYGYAAAATLVMFGVTLAIIYAQYRVVKRWRHAVAA